MLKTTTLTLAFALALAGCSTPQSKAKDADDAQHEANQQASQADEEAKLKGDAIRDEAAAENAQNARDATKKGAQAQNNSNQKATEASDSLARARIEARDESEKKLTGLEQQFAEVKPKLVKKLSKTDATNIVNELTAKSDAVRSSIGDLTVATADSLEPVKSTIKQRLEDFDKALNEAKKRL